MPRDPELKANHLKAIAELGIKKQSPLKTIRQFCFECQGESWKAVKNCEETTCSNWSYRHGFNPFSKSKNNNLTITPKFSNKSPNIRVPFDVGLNQGKLSGDRVGLGGRDSERIPVRRLPVVKIAILEFLISKTYDGAFINPQFHGSDIEQIPCPKFCTSETRRRRFRELNSDYNIARCINPNKSLYEITVSKERLLEIINILRRHEYGKRNHAVDTAK